MGNSQTEEPDNPNFNMAEYNQKMRNTSIYSNATLNPTAAQVYQAEQPKQFNVSQIEKKKLETKFAFFKDSLKIVQKPQRQSAISNSIIISFKYMAKQQGQMSIYFDVRETQQPDTNITVRMEATTQHNEQVEPTGTQGKDFSKTITYNKMLGTLFSKHEHNHYALVIAFTSPDQNLYVYLKPMNDFKKVHLIKSKIETGGMGYFFEQVYGINKPDEERTCIICYTQPSNVTIYPCRHMCLCTECCQLLKTRAEKCPICRSAIESFMVVNAH